MAADDRYQLRQRGTSIDRLGLPDTAERSLLGRGYATVEQLYGAMCGSPDALRKWLADFGVNFNELQLAIRALLPVATVEELEKPVDVTTMPTGARLPNKD